MDESFPTQVQVSSAPIHPGNKIIRSLRTCCISFKRFDHEKSMCAVLINITDSILFIEEHLIFSSSSLFPTYFSATTKKQSLFCYGAGKIIK